jgi:hypothetical protein
MFSVAATSSTGQAVSYQWQRGVLDGVSWTPQTFPELPVGFGCEKIVYGNGLFVAVSNTTTAATSPDGVTWTTQTLPLAVTDIIYANGLFVAVGGRTNCITSPDGLAWTARTIPTAPGTYSSWGGIVFGNGIFAVFANSASTATGALATSPDGITWTARSAPTSFTTAFIQSCYGNGTFVAFKYNSNVFATSTDGISWAQRFFGTSGFWSQPVYGANKFLVLSGSGSSTSVFTSANGVSWSVSNALPAMNAPAVSFGGGTFLIASQPMAGLSNLVFTSPDAVNWTTVLHNLPEISNSRVFRLAYGAGLFVVVTESLSGAANASASTTSRTFLDLTGATSSDLNLTGLIAENDDRNQYRAVATSPGAVAVTSNFAALSVPAVVMGQAVQLPATRNWGGIAYGGGKFVAVAYDSYFGAISSDGFAWTQITLPSSAYWESIAYGNGRFVATPISNSSSGLADTIAAYSVDGVTWATATLPASGWWRVIYGNNTFLAFEFGGFKVATSTNGSAWTLSATLPITATSITYGNGRYVALYGNGANNDVAHSADGITWAQSTLPQQMYWRCCAYGNGKFIAIGYGVNGVGTVVSNTVAYSVDGVTWLAASGLPKVQVWSRVIYADNKFFAIAENTTSLVGNGSNVVAYSADGITWTGVTTTGTRKRWDAAYGNNLFVMTLNQSTTYTANVADIAIDYSS